MENEVKNGGGAGGEGRGPRMEDCAEHSVVVRAIPVFSVRQPQRQGGPVAETASRRHFLRHQLLQMAPRMQQPGVQLQYQHETPEQIERNKILWQQAVVLHQQKLSLQHAPLPQQDLALEPHVQQRLHVWEQQLQVQRLQQLPQEQQQPPQTWPQVLHQLQQQPYLFQNRSRQGEKIQILTRQTAPVGMPQAMPPFCHVGPQQNHSPSSGQGQSGLSTAGKWLSNQGAQHLQHQLQLQPQNLPVNFQLQPGQFQLTQAQQRQQAPQIVADHRQLWQRTVVMHPQHAQAYPMISVQPLSQPTNSTGSIKLSPSVSQEVPAHQRHQILQPQWQQQHQGQTLQQLPQVLQQKQVQAQGQVHQWSPEVLFQQDTYMEQKLFQTQSGQYEEVQHQQKLNQPEPVAGSSKQENVPVPMTLEERAAKMLKDATGMNEEMRAKLIRERHVRAAEYFFQKPLLYQFLCAASRASTRIFRRMYNNFPFIYKRISPDSLKHYEEFKLFVPDKMLTMGADMIFDQWETDGSFEGDLSKDAFETLEYCPRYLSLIREQKGHPEEGGAPYIFTREEIDSDD